MRELFLGNFRFDVIEDLKFEEPDRPEFLAFMKELRNFLIHRVDPVAIDVSGEYPKDVLLGLRELGAFGLKIPREYGGLGMNHREYVRVMALLGSHDANVTALLSAHQAIGVPQPIQLFGTEAQKRKYLPRCAKGAISAFALTEPGVGSDPAKVAATAKLSDDGKEYVIDGHKLWCTNGTLAELIVVMAKNPDTDRINAFVVEMDTPGIKILNRCRFMGLHALANAEILFENVRVPRENLIGEDGDGLKIALVTLNTGRLSIPAATAGGAKRCAEIVRKWSSARVQWGQPIGKHEAVAQMNASVVASAYAMESVAQALGELADSKSVDIRLEAAAAKEWNTVTGWKLTDTTLQVRGGRGYETESSLAARGEPAIGVERMMRDSRINLIFEGSSEIMHLFMAREAVDKHLDVAGALVDPKATLGQKLKALPSIIAFYAWWYPTRWFGWGLWPSYSRYGAMATHLRFISRSSRRLARAVFHGMARYQATLERKQAFLFRAVDIAIELFVMAVTVRRAALMSGTVDANGDAPLELADLVARNGRRKVDGLFHALWNNEDESTALVGRGLLQGRYAWLEDGIVPLNYEESDLVPGDRTGSVPAAATGTPSGIRPMAESSQSPRAVEDALRPHTKRVG